MKQKKILTITLCAVLLFTVLAGCGNDDVETIPDDTLQPAILDPTAPADIEGDIIDHQQSHAIDYEAAFATYSPDTVMMIIGDYTVTWAELFAFICRNVKDVLEYDGIRSWSDILYEDMSYADVLLNYSSDTVLMYKTIEYGADLVGVTLSAEIIEYMESEFELTKQMLGSEEDVLKVLWEMDGISSIELFDYFRSIGFLLEEIKTEVFGLYGERLSDDDLAEFTINDGYLMAKHILCYKTDEDDDPAFSMAEDILQQLDSYDGDDFEAFFDELMWELSDDSDALWMFPNGYLFQYGDMVPEFYDACTGLETDTYSRIVETGFGYHIIYRKPIDFDEVPTTYYNQLVYGYISEEDYIEKTLRNIVATELFESMLDTWRNSLDVEYTAAYTSMDFSKVFDLGED